MTIKKKVVIESVANDAQNLVLGDRRVYGDMAKVHYATAEIWNAYLGVDCITGEDVATMMSLLKKVRAKHGKFHRDNYVDDVGYVLIAAALAADTEDAVQEIKETLEDEGRRGGLYVPNVERGC